MVFVFFFKQKTAYEILIGLVGSEMCIRDRTTGVSAAGALVCSGPGSGHRVAGAGFFAVRRGRAPQRPDMNKLGFMGP